MVKNNLLNRNIADYMGMLSTVINGLVFKEVINKLGYKAKIYSAIKIEKVTSHFSFEAINNDLNNGEILIFVGGTGHPYFTTDTACVISALETNSNIILVGKNNVNGVYSSDPNKTKKAQFYTSLTFLDAIKKNLKVMDLSALSMCRENKIDLYVFNILEKNGIIKVLQNKTKFTHIHN